MGALNIHAGYHDFTFDANQIFKDAGLVGVTAWAQVAGANHAFDVGPGFFLGHCVNEVSVIEIASDDELYRLILMGSDDPLFLANPATGAGIHELASLSVGAAGGLQGDTAKGVGRYVFPFTNLVEEEFIVRYLALRLLISGTVATGINLDSRVGLMP